MTFKPDDKLWYRAVGAHNTVGVTFISGPYDVPDFQWYGTSLKGPAALVRFESNETIALVPYEKLSRPRARHGQSVVLGGNEVEIASVEVDGYVMIRRSGKNGYKGATYAWFIKTADFEREIGDCA